MTPGSVIVASLGSGSQLPHTDVAIAPTLRYPSPPYNRDISGCHLSSFLCLLQRKLCMEEYQVQVQAWTALGEAALVRTGALGHRSPAVGGHVADDGHQPPHGMLALPDAKDGLHGALFNLWTPGTKHRHHQPNNPHLDSIPPLEALAVARDFSSCGVRR